MVAFLGLWGTWAADRAFAAGGCDPSNTRTTTICHVPPGDPTNAQTLCVGNAAVKSHLANHALDSIGACARCGDGVCNGDEDCTSCSADCGQCDPEPSCGDGRCNGAETCTTCSTDCGPCAPVCGDGNCDPNENCSSCPADCGPCPVPTYCCQKIDGTCSTVTDCNAECLNDPSGLGDSCFANGICTESGCA
jgi:hypothetical protein